MVFAACCFAVLFIVSVVIGNIIERNLRRTLAHRDAEIRALRWYNDGMIHAMEEDSAAIARINKLLVEERLTRGVIEKKVEILQGVLSSTQAECARHRSALEGVAGRIGAYMPSQSNSVPQKPPCKCDHVVQGLQAITSKPTPF